MCVRVLRSSYMHIYICIHICIHIYTYTYTYTYTYIYIYVGGARWPRTPTGPERGFRSRHPGEKGPETPSGSWHLVDEVFPPPLWVGGVPPLCLWMVVPPPHVGGGPCGWVPLWVGVETLELHCKEPFKSLIFNGR